MEADWDCLAQILETMQDPDSYSPTIEHIKGHQDDHTLCEELSQLAQLNYDADAFATTFLRSNPYIDHTTVHQFPTGECLLQLKHGTITRDIKHKCKKKQTKDLLTVPSIR